MDILTRQDNAVIFEGFDLIKTGKITVKEFNHSLVIIPKEQLKTERHHIFFVENKKTTSQDFITLIKKYCRKERTVFILLDGVYYQAEDITI